MTSLVQQAQKNMHFQSPLSSISLLSLLLFHLEKSFICNNASQPRCGIWFARRYNYGYTSILLRDTGLYRMYLRKFDPPLGTTLNNGIKKRPSLTPMNMLITLVLLRPASCSRQSPFFRSHPPQAIDLESGLGEFQVRQSFAAIWTQY